MDDRIDPEAFGTVTAIVLGFGGALAVGAWLDRIGYLPNEYDAALIVFCAFLAIFLLFIPCCIFWSFVAWGPPGRGLPKNEKTEVVARPKPMVFPVGDPRAKIRLQKH